LLGDTDLDGAVNVADLANLAGNFGATSGGTWVQGDFDYNGNVNVADLADLAGNFGETIGGGSDGSGHAGSAASAGSAARNSEPPLASPLPAARANQIPEPATSGVVIAAVAGVVARRRHKDGRLAAVPIVTAPSSPALT
jgi:hypothetical protein